MKVKTKVPVFFFFFFFGISLSWYVVGFSPVFSRMHLSLYTPPMASSIPNLRRLFAQEKVEIEHFYSTLEMSSYQNRDFFLHFDHRKSQCLKIKKTAIFSFVSCF